MICDGVRLMNGALPPLPLPPLLHFSYLPCSIPPLRTGNPSCHPLLPPPASLDSPRMAAVPADLKPISAYLARAGELAKADPAIAYWCSSLSPLVTGKA